MCLWLSSIQTFRYKRGITTKQKTTKNDRKRQKTTKKQQKPGITQGFDYVKMNWIILIVAGLCEVGFTYSLGKAKGVTGTEWWTWIAAFALLYVLSAVLLAKATQTIPLGTAYPVWTGIGAVGAVVVGIFIFHEPATFWRLFFLTTLIGSIIGLKALS